ncbi:MFS transporter [Bacillus sp. AFS018417]|uniref:MFS transporter n=1 Tax=unclassified Bacillus (in: firmicutes) TaxID=185979 RepID=UPI000BF9B0DE|nr:MULTISPECIES: MFS transporter [unclassified Bacillus (in: firmicutes)]MCP1125705.1 MFS transporter [Bacillus sp. 3103sda1]PEZ08885.1 MFS transporter [Bacillus sp. AFS018417]
MDTPKKNKWFALVVLILGGGTIFKLPFLKDAFYIPMMEYFHLSHTQIGVILSIYGIIQAFGYIASMYIVDRFSKKKIIPFSLIGVGLSGLYLTTFPGYYGVLTVWIIFALFAETAYWPALIKAVRLLGDKDEQGRVFGFLEAGRGVVDTIVAFSALAIFSWLGSGAAGFRGAIIFLAATAIVIGIISYFLVEDDVIKDTDEQGNKINKNKAALEGALQALKMPEVWAVSFTIFSVYSVYIGLTYFIPFLKEIYGMPVALVGAYGIINQYALKMLGGPLGGFLADKKFKSPSKYLRVAFIAAIIGMTIFIFLPHETMNVYVGMIFTLSFGTIIFTQRAVFFAPIDEVGIPREISGSSVSIACLIGYAPSMFAFSLYGSMLDRTPGMDGYKHVFLTMIAFSVLGLIISSYLVRIVKKKNELVKNETSSISNEV